MRKERERNAFLTLLIITIVVFIASLVFVALKMEFKNQKVYECENVSSSLLDWNPNSNMTTVFCVHNYKDNISLSSCMVENETSGIMYWMELNITEMYK